MTWPERHDLIINGIDFDAELERLRNDMYQKIEFYFVYKYIDHINQVREVLFNSMGIPKI